MPRYLFCNLFLAGEQGSEVHELHVEPSVLGDGGSSRDGIGLSKWWCEWTGALFF